MSSSVKKKKIASYWPLGVFNWFLKSTNRETSGFGGWYKGPCTRVLNAVSHVEAKDGEHPWGTGFISYMSSDSGM